MWKNYKTGIIDIMNISNQSVIKKILMVCIVLFCISFVCNGINIFMFYRGLYLSELDKAASWQLEGLMSELKDYHALSDWMKAWRTDPAWVDLPVDVEDKTRGRWHDIYGEVYEYYSIKGITAEKAEELLKGDGAGAELPLTACYVLIADEFDHFNRYSRMDNIACFYPEKDGTAFMYFVGSSPDENGCYSFALGNTNPFNLDLHPRLKACIEEGREEIVREILNSSVDGRRFIQYYVPLFDKNGELICVLSESVWWIEYIERIVMGAVAVEGVNALFHIVILLILLHLLNVAVGRPMNSIKKAVVAYGEDKDTSHFVNSLVPLGALDNEFGLLSEELAVMALELREYMEKVVALTEEKKHLEGQLAMAVELKHQLMPNVFPAFPDEKRMSIYADQVAFEKIGGDYYDFFAIDRDHIAVVIADIFDGGTPSALFMVAFKIILSQIASYGLPPSKIMEVVNNRLSRYNEDDLTLSAWLGIYEISTGHIDAVNAGHECPLIISDKGVKEIEENVRGFIVGMAEGMIYPEYSFTLEPGSRLFLYTDGIINAKNPSGESFGYDRMVQVISGTGASDGDVYSNIQREIGAVQEAVFEFTGDETLAADITMLILGRNV